MQIEHTEGETLDPYAAAAIVKTPQVDKRPTIPEIPEAKNSDSSFDSD